MTAHTESHVITFTRDMDRALQVKSYRNSVDLLIDGIASQSRRQRGWSFDEDVAGYTDDTSQPDTPHRYTWKLHVNFASATTKPNATEFPSIVYTLYGRAIKPAGGRWVLAEVDGKPYAPPAEADAVGLKMEADQIGYADCEIPADWDSHFEHLYGLDSHISRVKSALAAGIASNWRNRFNTVLAGPPGCGKSDIALSMKAALGDGAVLSFDATATTAAGLIKTLNDLEIMPRVIIFEEIEKANSDALLPMLGIADQRGEINKTTARGEVQKSVKALCIATVNDFDLFQRMQSGALNSRFSNKVHFKQPEREVSMRILRREIAKVDGDQEWAEPALDYCESHGITDVREMISICLCGADGLLDGSYQKMMDETGTPQD
jgi:AAA domain (dynein-related subfamily)